MSWLESLSKKIGINKTEKPQEKKDIKPSSEGIFSKGINAVRGKIQNLLGKNVLNNEPITLTEKDLIDNEKPTLLTEKDLIDNEKPALITADRLILDHDLSDLIKQEQLEKQNNTSSLIKQEKNTFVPNITPESTSSLVNKNNENSDKKINGHHKQLPSEAVQLTSLKSGLDLTSKVNISPSKIVATSPNYLGLKATISPESFNNKSANEKNKKRLKKYQDSWREPVFLDRPAEPLNKIDSNEKLAIDVADIFKSTRDEVHKVFSHNVNNPASLFYTLGGKNLKSHRREYRQAVLDEVQSKIIKLLKTAGKDAVLDNNFLEHVNRKLTAVGCDSKLEQSLIKRINKILTEKIFDEEVTQVFFSDKNSWPSYRLSLAEQSTENNATETENNNQIIFFRDQEKIVFKQGNLARLLLLELEKLIANKSNVFLPKITDWLNQNLRGELQIKDVNTIRKVKKFFQEFFSRHYNEKVGRLVSETIMASLSPKESLAMAG